MIGLLLPQLVSLIKYQSLVQRLYLQFLTFDKNSTPFEYTVITTLLYSLPSIIFINLFKKETHPWKIDLVSPDSKEIFTDSHEIILS